MDDDRTRLSLQGALMALSAWVLGALLLGASFRIVGLGGIAVMLLALVAVRLVDLGDE